jgi:glutamate synthase (NADPH/NADH) small chain
MEKGREAAQRVHEYLMDLEANHVSFYEKYYTRISYDRMLEGKNEVSSPPD